MDKTSSQISKKGMFAALAGTVLVALCCFTPILLVLIGAVAGLGRHDRTDHCILSAMAQVGKETIIGRGAESQLEIALFVMRLNLKAVD